MQDVEDLVPALARLSGHAPMCVFYCEDRRRWEEILRALASGRALPDPHLEVNFRVEDARVLQPAIGAVAYSPDQLSETIHTSLDKAIFDELHGALFDCLGRPAPAEMGWIIEARLKEQLWTLWRGWHAMIDPDPVTRRRFLLLLATERKLGNTGTCGARTGRSENAAAFSPESRLVRVGLFHRLWPKSKSLAAPSRRPSNVRPYRSRLRRLMDRRARPHPGGCRSPVDHPDRSSCRAKECVSASAKRAAA